MKKTVRRVIYVVVFCLLMLYVWTSGRPYVVKMWQSFFIEIISICVAGIFLDEKPMEFFDNFLEYKQAPVSSFIVILALITGIVSVIITLAFCIRSVI